MGIIYEESSIWLFLLVTCILGGTAAWMSGRAVANGWQPLPQLIFYILLLGVAVRFIHHALFGGTMFSAHYYVADTIVLMILGLLGFRYTRASQMVTQYRWMYERTGPLTWRERQPSGAADLKTR